MHSLRNTVNDSVVIFYGDRGQLHLWGAWHNVRDVKSLCCPPETSVILCVNYTNNFFKGTNVHIIKIFIGGREIKRGRWKKH